jgi:hypothetical protein
LSRRGRIGLESIGDGPFLPEETPLDHPRRSRFPSLVLGFALLGAAAPLAAAAPQDPPAKPPEKTKTPEELKAEEIKAYLKQYEEQLAKMTDEDAIAGIEKMKGWYVDPKVGEPEKTGIMKTFSGKVVKQKREAYLEAACKALGDMGGDTSVGLLKYLVDSSLNQKSPIYNVARAGLAGLGKIASPKPGDVKFLTDLLKGKDEVIGDAARAIGGYAKAPGSVRHDLFEELLKRSEGTFSKSENNDNNAKRSWNIWGTEIVDSMKKLSKQNFEKPPEFRKWLNNKDEGGGKNPKTWADPPDAAGGGH